MSELHRLRTRDAEKYTPVRNSHIVHGLNKIQAYAHGHNDAGKLSPLVRAKQGWRGISKPYCDEGAR